KRLSPISTLFTYTTLFRSHFLRYKADLILIDPHTDSDIVLVDRFRKRRVTFRRKVFGIRIIQHFDHGADGLVRKDVTGSPADMRSEEHTSELQSRENHVFR